MRTVLVVRSIGDEASDWAAALNNDAEAFAAIFDRHHGRVYRHALRLTENPHDAEDITAGAFLELWRRRKSVRIVDGSTLPWLLVTATNLARNLTRGLRRYRTLTATLPRGEVGRSVEDVTVERMEGTRLSSQIREALTTLSPSDAGLISLTMLEHYSPADAALALGISDGAARTRLRRARSRMAGALDIADNEDMTREDGR